MLMRIDATKRQDIELLSKCLLTAPREDWWRVNAVVYDLGLMKPRNTIDRFIFWIAKKMGGDDGFDRFFEILHERSPETEAKLMQSTVDWVLNGVDREDPDSAGGWSQREVDLLLSRIEFSMLRDPQTQEG